MLHENAKRSTSPAVTAARFAPAAPSAPYGGMSNALKAMMITNDSALITMSAVWLCEEINMFPNRLVMLNGISDQTARFRIGVAPAKRSEKSAVSTSPPIVVTPTHDTTANASRYLPVCT